MTQLQLSFGTPAKGEYPLEGAQRGTCRSCGAAIAWTKTANGTAIPLDVAYSVSYDGALYAPTHFAYCPQGREWRRKK
jgi:hypothetical protein